MSLEVETPTSFLGINPNDLVQATKVHEEFVIEKKVHQENRCIAWAPDDSYIAWSQGGGIVYLLPWDAKNGKLLKGPVRDQSFNTVETIDEPDLGSLPRLPTVNDDGSFNNADDEFSIFNENVYNNCSQKNDDDEKPMRKCFRIDCMDQVWSMAFGTGVSRSAVNVHRRFTFKSDLILATGLQGGIIKLWNIFSGNLLMELLDHKKMVHGLSFKCDGTLGLVSCSSDCTIKFWDLNLDGNMYKTLRFKENVLVFSCKWSPNCKHVAAVGMNKCAYIWNSENFNKARKLTGHLNNVVSCDFSSDGAILATASFDTRVILWDPYTGDQIKILGHMFPSPRPIYAGGANDFYVRSVSFSRDGHQLMTVADDGYIRFWALDSPGVNPVCVSQSTNLLTCTFSSNSNIGAVGRRDGRIEFFQPQKMEMASLQHLCRVAIRKKLQDSSSVDLISYPTMLKEFLKYKLF